MIKKKTGKKKTASAKPKKPAPKKPAATKADLEKEVERLTRKIARLAKDASLCKEARIASQESETRLNAILEATSDAIIMVDGHGITSVWNRSAERIFGYTAEEMIGDRMSKYIIPPSYREDHRRGLTNFAKTGKGHHSGQTLELSALRKDGTEFPIEIAYGHSSVNFHGKWHAVAMVRDITVRKQIQDELRRSRRQMEIILDNAATGICMVSNGRLEWGNKSMERIFRMSREKAVGMAVTDFYPDEDRERLIAEDNALRESDIRGSIDRESRLKRADGELFWARYIGQVIEFDEETGLSECGHDKPSIWVFEDISERKAIEKKLAQTMAQMNAILENAGIGITLSTIKRDGDNRFIWLNKRFREMLQIPEDQRATDIRVDEVYTSADDYKSAVEGLAEQILKGETVIHESPTRRRDGSLFWGRRILRLVDPEMPEAGIIGIMEDFSQRREMEEALRQAKEKAEQATKLKDKFISLVAHDLKSPFTSFLGILKLIQRDTRDPLSNHHAEMIERVVKGGEGLVKMIDELLKVSRFQTGTLTPEKDFFDASLIAITVAGNLRQLAEEKGIEIVNAIPRYTRAYADKNLYMEVLSNLVSNAVKFCNQGDSITVGLDEAKPGTVTVTDTGIGIPQETIPKLFLHGERTSTPGTGGEKGTGLGLPFCNDIMVAHGGSISVTSEEGKGTVFSVTLPVVKPKVLIVDDDPDARYMFAETLRQASVEIIEAGNGREAIDIVKKSSPRLILTDLNMPIMDGYHFIELLKADPATRPLPVVVITSSHDIEVREKLFGLGAEDYVTKPVAPEDLIPRVRRYIY